MSKHFATTIRVISGLSLQTPSERNDKIRRIENVPLDEIQHRTIDLRPLRIHPKAGASSRSECMMPSIGS
jgi:hypothetical protein